MKSLVLAMAVLGATALPVAAQESNMSADDVAPAMLKSQPMPTASAGQSDQSYGMSTAGTSQAGRSDQDRYKLTPAQQELYKGGN